MCIASEDAMHPFRMEGEKSIARFCLRGERFACIPNGIVDALSAKWNANAEVHCGGYDQGSHRGDGAVLDRLRNPGNARKSFINRNASEYRAFAHPRMETWKLRSRGKRRRDNAGSRFGSP